MPVYELRCTSCAKRSEQFRTVKNHGQWTDCACGGQQQQIISRPMSVHVDNMPDYVCPATGERITSRKQRNDSFARHGLVDANDMGEAEGTYTPLSEVEVDGMGVAANLNDTPSNAKPMSRRQTENLEQDIADSIKELSS